MGRSWQEYLDWRDDRMHRESDWLTDRGECNRIKLEQSEGHRSAWERYGKKKSERQKNGIRIELESESKGNLQLAGWNLDQTPQIEIPSPNYPHRSRFHRPTSDSKLHLIINLRVYIMHIVVAFTLAVLAASVNAAQGEISRQCIRITSPLFHLIAPSIALSDHSLVLRHLACTIALP